MKAPALESLLDKVPILQECNFIKKRLQHSCFPVKFPKYLRTPFFYRTPMVAGCFWSTVLSEDFVDISYEECFMSHTRSITMAAGYLCYYFLIKIAFWFLKYLFRWMGTLYINHLRVLAKRFTLCSIYRSNWPLWKIYGIA